MGAQLKNVLKTLGFFGIGFTILYLFYRSQQAQYELTCAAEGIPMDQCSLIDKFANDLAGANFGWIAIVAICFLISNLCRALRWNMMLKPLGVNASLFNSLGAISIAYFANMGIPRSGEVIRSVIISRYEDVKVEAAMGTIINGRIIDVICLLIAIGLAFVFSFGDMTTYFSENMDASQLGILGKASTWIALAVLGLLGLGIVYKYWNKIIQGKLGNIIKGFVDGLQSIRQVENVPLFIFYTLMIWLMYYLMTYLCFFSYDPTSELSPVAGLVTFVFGSFGIVIPSPGGMGTYQYLVSQALGLYGISVEDSFSFANIVFVAINLFCNVFFGILFWITMPIYNRNKI